MAKAQYKKWLEPENLIKLEGWAKDGLTDKEIAEQKLDVSERTLTDWKKRFNLISSALKRGKEVVDREVENSLLKNALGYEYEETKTIIEIMPDGEKKTRIEKVKKYALPNTTAQIFWLKNRKPNEWRDKRETEVTGNLNLANTALEIDEYLNSDKS